MRSPAAVRRVILVVLDGLRADAIALFPLPHLSQLATQGAATFSARTVTPSVTAAAMTSLLSGISPHEHGIESDSFAFPKPGPHLVHLPGWLRKYGIESTAYFAALPRPFRELGNHFARRAGVLVRFEGESSDEILVNALDDLQYTEDGFFLLHWPDADQAGHAHGWASGPYRQAAGRLDTSLGRLVELCGITDDPDTVLIVLSDHGGGGAKRHDHDSLHPLDITIPLIMVGGAIARVELTSNPTLLDVPATVAWLLTGQVPAAYRGRALVEAFAPEQPRRATAA